MSGPEAPEGWSYDGPHEAGRAKQECPKSQVTWGNKPKVHNFKGAFGFIL